jgi:hypothetical protein
LDYSAEAARLGTPPVPIIDGHAHVNGERAAAVWAEAADLYGVERVYSQTQLAQAPGVRRVLGDRVRFVAIPEYMAPDKPRAFRAGFLENLERWHGEFGARMVKFWTAPRFRDIAEDIGGDYREIWPFDAPWRMRVAERAAELGMAFMVHVADPDTWFATRYADARRYGGKAQQYESLSRFLDAFDVPCLIAHMGGWPEDLGFVARLLDRHPRAVIDTSATKWMVRELSRHPREEFVSFFERYSGRIVFGSDIVTHDEHLTPKTGAEAAKFGLDLAGSPAEAFELYASRYWALRTMFETEYDGQSSIADPDLAMVDPARFDAMSTPRLVGRSLSPELLRVLYRGACEASLDAWYTR